MRHTYIIKMSFFQRQITKWLRIFIMRTQRTLERSWHFAHLRSNPLSAIFPSLPSLRKLAYRRNEWAVFFSTSAMKVSRRQSSFDNRTAATFLAGIYYLNFLRAIHSVFVKWSGTEAAEQRKGWPEVRRKGDPGANHFCEEQIQLGIPIDLHNQMSPTGVWYFNLSLFRPLWCKICGRPVTYTYDICIGNSRILSIGRSVLDLKVIDADTDADTDTESSQMEV